MSVYYGEYHRIIDQSYVTQEEYEEALRVILSYEEKLGYSRRHGKLWRSVDSTCSNEYSACNPMSLYDFEEFEQAIVIAIENFNECFYKVVNPKNRSEFRFDMVFRYELDDTSISALQFVTYFWAYVENKFYQNNHRYPTPKDYAELEQDSFIASWLENYRSHYGIIDPYEEFTLELYHNMWSGRANTIFSFDTNPMYIGLTWQIPGKSKPVYFKIPAFRKTEHGLQYWDASYRKTALKYAGENSRTSVSRYDYKEIIKEYFEIFPEKKPLFEAERENLEHLIADKSKIEECAKKLEFDVANLMAQIDETQNMIRKLKRKIFGKEKAAAKIVELESCNQNKIHELEIAENSLSEYQQKLLLVSDIDGAYEKLLQKYDYCIQWK